MTNSNAKTRLPAADSNRLMKKALKVAFPGTKFSCRMSRGTGYGNVHVDWTDGPTVEQVQEVTRRFEGQGFDGMTDSSYHKPTAIEVAGATFESGLSLILLSRSYGAESFARATAELRAEGYVGTDDELRGAARAVLNGIPAVCAAEHHHLRREI